jgi:hypothetical protein
MQQLDPMSKILVQRLQRLNHIFLEELFSLPLEHLHFQQQLNETIDYLSDQFFRHGLLQLLLALLCPHQRLYLKHGSLALLFCLLSIK